MKKVIMIRDLIESDFNQLPQNVITDFSSTDTIEVVKQKVKNLAPDAEWGVIESQLLSQIESLLNKPILDVLQDAWKDNHEVNALMSNGDELEQSQTGISLLSDHEIKSTYNPTLDVNLNGEAIGQLRFFLGIKLDLEDVSVKVSDDGVLEVLSGKADGQIVLQHQNATFVDQAFQDSNLAELQGRLAQIEQQVMSDSEIVESQSQQSEVDVVKASKKGRSKSNFMQFMLGIGISLMALFLFWLLQ